MYKSKEFHEIHKLILITDTCDSKGIDSYLKFIEKCARGGITCLQLRQKNVSPPFLYEFGTKLKTVLAPFGIPLMLNDNIEIAKKLDADGVHLGHADTSPVEARKILGPGKIIGLSVNSIDQMKHANDLDVGLAYVSASSVFDSRTVPVPKPMGLDGLKDIVRISKYPVVAVGGINLHNAADVMRAGASGIALVKAVHEAKDPEAMVKELRKIVESGRPDMRIEIMEKLDICTNQIRKTRPLVVNLTNYVTMDFVANALLALGAAPIMCNNTVEHRELISISGAVCINTGTFDEDFMGRMKLALVEAKSLKKPVVLDPSGCDLTDIRTRWIRESLEHVSVLRGTPTEILSLNGVKVKVAGTEEALESAKALSKQHDIVVSITGTPSIVVLHDKVQRVDHSDEPLPLMDHVIGMGCTLTAIMGALCAVGAEDLFSAAVISNQVHRTCANEAALRASGPGSLKTEFLDSLYRVGSGMMRK